MDEELADRQLQRLCGKTVGEQAAGRQALINILASLYCSKIPNDEQRVTTVASATANVSSMSNGTAADGQAQPARQPLLPTGRRTRLDQFGQALSARTTVR
jgi:hypothetical protein